MLKKTVMRHGLRIGNCHIFYCIRIHSSSFLINYYNILIIYRVEIAVWTHYVASDLKPEWLEGLSELGNGTAVIPTPADTTNDASNDVDTVTTTTTTTLHTTNGVPPSSIEASDESNLEPAQPPAAQNGNGKCEYHVVPNLTLKEA